MTAQSREVVFINRQPEQLRSLPLDPFLDAHKIDLRVGRRGWSTGLFRGYQGIWELHDKRLYLLGLLDYAGDPIDTAQVFGTGHTATDLPRLADWFTGRLDLPRGPLLLREHMGWGGRHAQILRLYLERGRLTHQRLYQQVPLMRRRLAEAMAHNHNLRAYVLTGRCIDRPEPLTWFTATGRQLLGLPAGADTDPDADPEDDHDGDDWLAAWAEKALARLRHPGQPPSAYSPR